MCDDPRRAHHLCRAIIGPVLVSAAPEPVEHGTLRLHYVQKPIGYEKYEIARDGEVLTLSGGVSTSAP
jgi:hypothetical protein